MAQVRVACPACQTVLALNHPWPAGLAARCPHCQMQFVLPGAEQFAAPDPLAPPWSDLQDDYASPGGYEPPAPDPQFYGAQQGQTADSAEGANKSLLWVILAALGGLVGTLVVLALVLLLDRGGQPIAQNIAPARQPLASAAPAGQTPDQAAAFANAPLSPAASSSPAAAPVYGAAPVAQASAAELADAARRAAAPATPAEMQQLLADLAPSRDGFRKRRALETLKKRRPLDSQRSEVLKAVSPLTQDSDSWLRESAIVVMGVWGTKDTAPMLVELLAQFDPGMRRAAIEALGKINDAASAAVLAPLLANQSDQHEAARSLEAIGPLAEPAVLPMLTHPDQRVRFEVCKLLGKIGGKDSVAAIKKLLLREQDGLVKLGAEGALKELGKKGL